MIIFQRLLQKISCSKKRWNEFVKFEEFLQIILAEAFKVPFYNLFCSNQCKLLFSVWSLMLKFLQFSIEVSYLVPVIAKFGKVQYHSICSSFTYPRTNLPLLYIWWENECFIGSSMAFKTVFMALLPTVGKITFLATTNYRSQSVLGAFI